LIEGYLDSVIFARADACVFVGNAPPHLCFGARVIRFRSLRYDGRGDP